MPYTAREKQRAVARLRRIKGQADALERAVLAGTDCGTLLQQISALRGATNGLMAEVLESHLRETFGAVAPTAKSPTKKAAPPAEADREAEIDRLVRLVRSYLK
jgi:FrmR/RcnR family transcriptional regulator, repressor of frmRAB operon